MKTIIYKQFIYSLLFLTAFLLPVACDDWNEPEIVDIDINSAKEQNPELWARYMQALRTYKQSEHYLSYAHFDNSPEKSLNEGSYLRSLPDSLDIVTLGNSHKSLIMIGRYPSIAGKEYPGALFDRLCSSRLFLNRYHGIK